MSHNALTHLDFLSKLPKLVRADLSHNQVRQLESNTFHRSARLHWLNLSANPMAAPPPANLFARHGAALGYLSLSEWAELETLPPKLLDPLPRLQQLEMRANFKLKSLPDDFFRFANGLRHLDLSNNTRLDRLPRSMTQLDALRSLNLDWTPLMCDCRSFWLAHWLETRSAYSKWMTSPNMICAGNSNLPLLETLWRLNCSAVRLERASPLYQAGDYGKAVTLTCNFTGNPPPNVTWVTEI